MPDVAQARILTIATNGFVAFELLKPLETLKQRGRTGHPRLALPQPGQGRQGRDNHARHGRQRCRPDAVRCVVVAGRGKKALRREPGVVTLVRSFVETGRPVAAICHAPWLLADADVVRGRTVTSWPSLRTDLRNAGANVVDQQVARDGNLVTSRKPDDIPAFTQEFIRLIETGAAAGQA